MMEIIEQFPIYFLFINLITTSFGMISLAPKDGDLAFDGVDHPVSHLDALTGGGAELHLVACQPGPDLLGADFARREGHPVLEQLGVDALDPHPALVDQGLVQPRALAPLEDAVRWDPAFGQLASLQQLPLQAGIGAVGLGPLLASPSRLGLGRLGQVRLEADGV